MAVEFVKLKRTYDLYAPEYEEAALRALRSGWYILGKELEAFEEAFACFQGVPYCIGVNSGTDALVLAVRALEIGPGDEVIVPANTYIASVMGITENGATPVFVEPDAFHGMDANLIEAAITDKTKAILPVHLYGQACDMASICAIAEKYGLYVIEDCAQSHGAKFGDTLAGSFGTIGCFSFYPTKPCGGLGDGGALVTSDPDLAKKLRMMRNYGSAVKYVNEFSGINSRLDEVQAAVLQVSLKHLQESNEYRRAIAKRYLTEICNDAVELPKLRENASHVFHVFAVLCDDRDGLQKHMLSCGVKTLSHYPIPPHLQQCYEYLGHGVGSFPISESYAARELSLPIYNGMPEEEVTQVIAAVNSYGK